VDALPKNTPQGVVARRDFLVLTEAGRRPAVAAVLNSDEALQYLRSARAAAREKAIAECKTVACLDAAFRWSSSDVDLVAARLSALVAANATVKAFAKSLRASGEYPLYATQDDAHLLATAWTDAAKGLNRIVDVYGDGQKPHYDKIDSMRYDPQSPVYFTSVRATAMLVQGESHGSDVFFPELKFAVMLLAANGRMDAARDWPLEHSQNAAAVAHAKTVHWAAYTYSVIVVPGEGPEEGDVEFSPLGRIRVESAARLYREGKAPFILVSGGTVHPSLTRYCEACEMKQELMTQWKIPESAIIIDPYARHTTTNLRNAVRQIVQYGLTTKKPMLVVSDYKQIDMIASEKFDARCLKEMRFKPYSTKERLSPEEVSMQPDVMSLQTDANDPMDP
jgi:uncharacterized SAM-binding protein YcdF (DUF218 family)